MGELMTEKCPYCDREFDTKRGLSFHRTATHNDSAKVEVECTNCGEIKTLRRSKANRSENNFCDNECYSEWISGENHPKWNREKVSCSNCGETKKVPQRDIRRNEYFFCDDNCRNDWQSENWIGKNHPKWKDEAKRALDYGEEWTRKRRNFVDNTKNVCCKCNSAEKDLDVELHVHHIVRPDKFDNVNEAHKEENMMRLCRQCHPTVENMREEKQFQYHPNSDGEWFIEEFKND